MKRQKMFRAPPGRFIAFPVKQLKKKAVSGSEPSAATPLWSPAYTVPGRSGCSAALPYPSRVIKYFGKKADLSTVFFLDTWGKHDKKTRNPWCLHGLSSLDYFKKTIRTFVVYTQVRNTVAGSRLSLCLPVIQIERLTTGWCPSCLP
jgi:hypothetical protein